MLMTKTTMDAMDAMFESVLYNNYPGCFDLILHVPQNQNTHNTFPSIKKVYFNNPVTVVIWDDGTKTVVKCQKQTGDTYSKETGLAMCIAKKALGNKGNYYDIFKKWIPELEDEYANRSCYSCQHRFGEDPDLCVNCDRDFSNWNPVK